jgi:PhnB protein
MNQTSQSSFAPILTVRKGTHKQDFEFYKKALGAVEIRSFDNDDGTIHVMEMAVDGALFHFHEENIRKRKMSPEMARGVTAIIGLMVTDVDRIMTQAESAGAKITSPAKDYDYGYRQGEFVDLMGHHWQIEKVI